MTLVEYTRNLDGDYVKSHHTHTRKDGSIRLTPNINYQRHRQRALNRVAHAHHNGNPHMAPPKSFTKTSHKVSP